MPYDANSLRSYVLNKMQAMLDRPKMFAPSPDALESMLQILEEILLHFGDIEPSPQRGDRFEDYLIDHNFGSASYCSRRRLDNPGVTDEELWQDLTSAWKDFFSYRWLKQK